MRYLWLLMPSFFVVTSMCPAYVTLDFSWLIVVVRSQGLEIFSYIPCLMQAGAISSLCCVPPSFSILDGCVFSLLKRDMYFINLTIVCGRYMLKDVLRLAPV